MVIGRGECQFNWLRIAQSSAQLEIVGEKKKFWSISKIKTFLRLKNPWRISWMIFKIPEYLQKVLMQRDLEASLVISVFEFLSENENNKIINHLDWQSIGIQEEDSLRANEGRGIFRRNV